MPTPKFHAYVARYPDPAELDADGRVDGYELVDVDVEDIEAAIEAEGWCGCYTLRGRPAVVVLFGDALPLAGRRYLRQN